MENMENWNMDNFGKMEKWNIEKWNLWENGENMEQWKIEKWPSGLIIEKIYKNTSFLCSVALSIFSYVPLKGKPCQAVCREFT